jgi:aspartokinase-like uncharacterized kinase
MAPGPIVVKVGGSLFDVPNLGKHLSDWLRTLPTLDVLLLPGGGATADVVRQWDRVYDFGEELAHWLALRALSLNALFLGAILPSSQVIEHPGHEANGAGLRIVDGYRFARVDELCPDCLPHRWQITSDSIAARVAVVAKASQLILLKSVTIPEGTDWQEAARRGWVDSFFGTVAVPPLVVKAVNFRAWCP